MNEYVVIFFWAYNIVAKVILANDINDASLIANWENKYHHFQIVKMGEEIERN